MPKPDKREALRKKVWAVVYVDGMEGPCVQAIEGVPEVATSAAMELSESLGVVVNVYSGYVGQEMELTNTFQDGEEQ